ncbi:MAG: HPr family phosphocarrier protein [Clostridia bacterium]|nr:HPr family phosphocarrier protein [Clostridia bacterium]
MKVFQIKLSTIEDVRDFVNIITLCPHEVDLASGRYIVDAKSIIGIFSLDLLKPIRMTVHADECDQLEKSIQRFIVE